MKSMLAVLLALATTVAGEEPKKKSEAEAAMEYYVEMAKPVEEHKRLAELAGSWKVTTKLWFGPGEPMSANGSGSGRMILGGRFLVLETDVKGALGSEAMTLMGFDRRTNEYTMTSADTLGTYTITAAGRYDDAKKGIVLHGSYAQPPTGQEQKYWFLWTRPSDKEQVMALYFVTNGKDTLVAETRMVRP
jgi:hypothetical protein